MFDSKIAQVIAGKLPFQPTQCQQSAILGLSKFIYSNEVNSIFLLKGYAGTGKTTLVSAFVEVMQQFNVKTELLAPTGRAAKVLSGYSNKPAHTIHKRIYRQQSPADSMGKFVLDFNRGQDTFFIVDEASMISNEIGDTAVFGSGRLLDDLIEFVYTGRNCRLILVGDVAQLPPVGLPISPALDARELEKYDMVVLEETLTEVVRQSFESGILYNATIIRNLIENQEVNGFFKIKIQTLPDIERVSGEDLIETINSCYGKFGEEETIIVTRSNKRANRFNEGVRRTILWREAEFCAGDLLMVVKNNYFWTDKEHNIEFIANGDTVRVLRVGRTEEMYGFRFVNATISLLDYNEVEMDCKLFLDTLMLEAPSFGHAENQKLFAAVQEDYLDIANKRKRWEQIKANPYFNALQVKYAYAITCHKAQGGQWDAVFIDHGYLLEEMINVEFMRWLYTAFTRPKKKLYLVNFDKNFFDE